MWPAARGGRAGPSGELEPAVEALDERRRRQHLAPAGGELDREREPVEATADFLDRVDVRARQVEVGANRSRALHEQPRGVEVEERRHGVLVLARQVERLAARDEQLQARARRHEVEDGSGRAGDVLEVVQQEQQLLSVELGLQRLAERRRHRLFDAQHSCDLGEDDVGVHRHRELDEERSVVELVDEVRRGLEREARLPGAARARQRHEPHAVVPQETAHGLELRLSADERRRQGGEVHPPPFERA